MRQQAQQPLCAEAGDPAWAPTSNRGPCPARTGAIGGWVTELMLGQARRLLPTGCLGCSNSREHGSLHGGVHLASRRFTLCCSSLLRRARRSWRSNKLDSHAWRGGFSCGGPDVPVQYVLHSTAITVPAANLPCSAPCLTGGGDRWSQKRVGAHALPSTPQARTCHVAVAHSCLHGPCPTNTQQVC